jgi:histidinol phosphatase-like enzyme (inositol monophosphatase family)
MESVDGYLHFLSGVLAETRRIALHHFSRTTAVRQKADGSPVTDADVEIEAYLRKQIRAAYPDFGILGEEQPSINTDAEHTWVVDPIDGTMSFLSGSPLWGTLLALLARSTPVIGVVGLPVLKQRWIGISGKKTVRNGRQTCTSQCEALVDAKLFATSPDMFSPREYEIFDAVSKRARFRRFGGDCHSYAMLASGHIDAVIEAGLEPYDYLALVPVITGAGGVVTDWRGEPLSSRSDGRVVAAATQRLHAEITNETRSVCA